MKLLMMALALLVMLAGSTAAQTPDQQPSAVAPPEPGATAAVYEAVARYQIKSWQQTAHAYCFRVKGQDADKEFLNRLKPLPVEPESDCTQKDTKTFNMSIIDKRTKKSAILFGLGSILWRSPTQAEVEGSYLCGSQCMAGGIYHVVLDQGQWTVTKFDVRIGQ
jgi:hypothetical protein